MVPVGLVALFKTLAGSRKRGQRPRYQFSLRWLLLLTSTTAVVLAAARLVYARGTGLLLAIAVACSTATLVAILTIGLSVRRSP